MVAEKKLSEKYNKHKLNKHNKIGLQKIPRIQKIQNQHNI